MPWFWFNAFVFAMLALDLGVVHRQARIISLREALAWTSFWVALAALFGIGVYFRMGRAPALEFATGYLIEESLSADNLFLFLVIFRHFAVPREYEHKVLFWGILGALFMRGILIWAGVSLVQRFQWVTYALGAFLLCMGLSFAFRRGKPVEVEHNPILRLARRFLPVTKDYIKDSFFVRGKDLGFGTSDLGLQDSIAAEIEAGRRATANAQISSSKSLYLTPLLLVLIVLETTDVTFAADSIPAVLGITHNALIVYAVNVFAIFGLRSLYFALAPLMDLLRYLPFGLSILLVFIGTRMLIARFYLIRTEIALAVVAGVLTITVAFSLAAQSKSLTE